MYQWHLTCYGAYAQVREKCCLEKKRNQTNVRNQCRGEPYVRPPDKNRTQTYVRE